MSRSMLDPQVAKLLAWVDKAGGPSYPEIGAAAARRHYEQVAATLDVAPAAMHAVDDLAVALPGRTLRVYAYQNQRDANLFRAEWVEVEGRRVELR